MKNRKNSFNDLFESFFEEAFNSSFFSRRNSFSSLGSFGSDNSFPSDDDVNFNKTTEEFENDNHVVKKEVWVSVDGTQRFERTTSQSKYEKTKPAELTKEDLKLMLNKAVENQEFEEAIRLRDEIKKFEK